MVNLIANTTTAKGLTVTCRLDHATYATGRKVTNAEMQQVNLHPATFHGEWNYVITPHRSTTDLLAFVHPWERPPQCDPVAVRQLQ